MDGANFLAYVKRTFKRTDKDTEIYEATTDTIADIRIQLKTEDYKEEAYTASIATLGEYKVGLPADFGHLIGDVTLVDNTNGFTQRLNKISKQSYDEKYGDRLHSDLSQIVYGVPTDFCIYAGQIYFGYVPDKITYKYYINYTTEAFDEVTASTDPVPFTDKYRYTLRAGVLANIYEGLEFFDESQYWLGKFNEGLAKMKANDDDNISSKEGVSYHGI